MEVRREENGDVLGSIPVQPSAGWRRESAEIDLSGVHPMYLRFRGKGNVDLQCISFDGEEIK